tara:strand:+ start:513 stop:1226 length:714 start_codon:yes stop_codon:yes gene_type:complete
MDICIIPARGGSKRIPRKNIMSFCDKPLIQWSIEAAIESNCFDRIIVSTDDKEIADITLNLGVEVPFIRPRKLADDFAGTTAVMKHALNWCLEKNYSLSKICCLYATAPFVESEDIIKGKNLLDSLQKDSFVFSASYYDYPIQKALMLNDNGNIEILNEKALKKRSQDLQEMIHDAGQFYWGTIDSWFSGKSIFSGSKPIILSKWKAIDIDTIEDWERAEIMFKIFLEQKRSCQKKF